MAAQPLTFAAGETSKTVSVAITHDAVAEPDETFHLFVMSNSTDVPSQFGINGAFINPGLANATFTIRDEGAPAATTLSIAPLNADKAEGSGPGANPFFFVITRSGGDLSIATTVNWIAGPGADPSADGADFGISNGFSFPFYTGSVTFNAGETSKTISASVIVDTVFEPDENFVVTLFNPSSGASIDPSHASAIGVIRNDDFLLTPSAALVAESAGTATFTLTRGANAPQQTVYLRTTETEGWTNNNDYTPLAAQPLTFAAGETSKTVSVAITHDAVAEPDETFHLFVMSNSTDVPSQFGINGAFINPGLANATFTIRDEGVSTFVPTQLNTLDAQNVWLSALNEGYHWQTPRSRTTISYYLAHGGGVPDSLADTAFSNGAPITFKNWASPERDAITQALGLYENVLNVQFVPANNIADAQIILGAADTQRGPSLPIARQLELRHLQFRTAIRFRTISLETPIRSRS